MTASTQQQVHATPHVAEEHILVVRRSLLLPADTAWHGLKSVAMEPYLTLIAQQGEFHPRSLMEQDPTFKQIIPYLIFRYQDQYFLMERSSAASEKRLASKCSLGIGGHVRKEDMEGATLFDWAQREFHEEVNYQGNLTITPLGILNDDTNEVGHVHIGFVLLLTGDSPEISIKSELKHGALVSLETCKAQLERLEGWSQIVLEHLMQQ